MDTASDLVTTTGLLALDVADPSVDTAGREVSTWALEQEKVSIPVSTI